VAQDLVEARVVRFLRLVAEARGKGLKVDGRYGAGEQRRLDPVQGVEEVVAAPDGAAAALARIPSPWRASSASTVASGAEAAGPDARPASAPARGAKATLFASRGSGGADGRRCRSLVDAHGLAGCLGELAGTVRPRG
jgi:hypothetical protein